MAGIAMQTRKHARFFSRFAAGSLAVVAAVLAEPSNAQQERLPIRGTSVTLTPPPGFTASRTERGIENTATGTTITISEAAPEAYAALAERFKSPRSLTEGYAEQNVTIRSVRTVDGKIPFASGRQTKNGKDMTRYLALLQGDKTVLVSFTIPDRSFTEADAEAVLRSIELTPEPTLEERLAELPFIFSAVQPYAVKDVINRQAVNLEVAGDRAQPTVTIGYGRSQALMGEEARVAVELVKNTGGYREAQITSQEPATFAGGNGYRVTAVIEDRTAIQYLRITSGGGYIRLFARGTTSAMQNAEAVLTEIAGSVEPR
jgi:hypothetical protein